MKMIILEWAVIPMVYLVFMLICVGGDVGDCFTINYYGGFQMGIESIGYVVCVILFIHVIWEIRKW